MTAFNETPDSFVDLNDLFPVLNDRVGLSVDQFKALVENTIYLFNRKGAKFRYRGDWDASTTYYNNDAYFDCVTYNGAVYVLKTESSIGETPSTSANWSSILLKVATSINSDSTNEYVAGAKAVYDAIKNDWKYQETVVMQENSSYFGFVRSNIDFAKYDYMFEFFINVNTTEAMNGGDYYSLLDSSGNVIFTETNWISMREKSSTTGSESANADGWAVHDTSSGGWNGLDEIGTGNRYIVSKLICEGAYNSVATNIQITMETACANSGNLQIFKNYINLPNINQDTPKGMSVNVNTKTLVAPYTKCRISRRLR